MAAGPLGLRNALIATLTYLRRNRVQAEIVENYGVSQPTMSRAISAITPLLVQALLDYVPTAVTAAVVRDLQVVYAGRCASGGTRRGAAAAVMMNRDKQSRSGSRGCHAI